MKVCFLIRAMEPGGAERQLAHLACALREQGHDIEVITFYAGGELEKQLRQAGVALKSLNKAGRWHIVRTLYALVRLVRQSGPDVLHGYLPTANLLALLAAPFMGQVKVVLGVRASDLGLSHYDLLTACSYRMERFFSRFADGIIANSSAGAGLYQASLKPGRVAVIPNGIDTDVFCPEPKPRPKSFRSLRHDLGIAEGVPLVGLVARIDPVKGHEVFLRCAAMVRDKIPDSQFVCVATNINAPDVDKSLSLPLSRLRHQAEALGIADCLHWSGPVADPPSIYTALDALALTSHSEGFPNVVAEAMACGTPCAVSHVGDAATIVGDCGVVAPRGDAAALAQGLVDLLSRTSQEKAALSTAARDRITSRFGKQALVENTMGFLNRVVAG